MNCVEVILDGALYSEGSRSKGKHNWVAIIRDRKRVKEIIRKSARIDLEVLNSVDRIMTTCTSDSECVSVCSKLYSEGLKFEKASMAAEDQESS